MALCGGRRDEVVGKRHSLSVPPLLPVGLVDVAGNSMAPTLLAGDTVLVHWGAAPRVGRIVVAGWPAHPGVMVVKRVLRHEGDLWWLSGDNPSESEDSRAHGGVPKEAVRGRVLLRVRRRDPQAGSRSRSEA